MARKRNKRRTDPARKRAGGKAGKRQLADKTVTPEEYQAWLDRRRRRAGE